MRGGSEEGQATIEYVLLIAVIAGLFVTLASQLPRLGIANMILDPIKGEFASAYAYGHPEAKGLNDDDGPHMHPRYHPEAVGGENFRIFINPEIGN